MWTSVLSMPAVYHPFFRYADGMKLFIPANRITPVFLSCPRSKSDAFKMPKAVLRYVVLTTALHCSASRTKGVLFLSVPTNHTGLSTIRLFKLHISVKGRCRWMRFRRLSALPSFPYDRSLTDKDSKGFYVSKFYLIFINHSQIIPTCFIVDSHYYYIYLLSLLVSVCTTCLNTKTLYFIHVIYSWFVRFLMLIPLAWPSKACVSCRSPAEIADSNPAGALKSVCFQCCVLSGRGVCDRRITSPEESCRLCVSLWSRITVTSRPSKNTLKSSRLRKKSFGYGPQ